MGARWLSRVATRGNEPLVVECRKLLGVSALATRIGSYSWRLLERRVAAMIASTVRFALSSQPCEIR